MRYRPLRELLIQHRLAFWRGAAQARRCHRPSEYTCRRCGLVCTRPQRYYPVGQATRAREAGRADPRELSELQDADQFDIRELVPPGDTVIALGHYRWRIKSNGQFYESDWAHSFAIRNGTISSFQEYVDTYAWAGAYQRFQAHAGQQDAQLIAAQERTGVKGSGTRCDARYRDIADRYLEG
jgi:ketosteroid isomerase-like protein